MRFDNSIYVQVIEILKGFGGQWSTVWTTSEDGWVTGQDVIVLAGHTYVFHGHGRDFCLIGEEEGEKLLNELTVHLTEVEVDPEWVDTSKAASQRSRRCRQKSLRRALRG